MKLRPHLRLVLGISLVLVLFLLVVALLAMAQDPSAAASSRWAFAWNWRATDTILPTSTSTRTAAATRTPTATASPTATRTSTATRTATAVPSPTHTRVPAHELPVPVILQELPLSCEYAGMRMVLSALLEDVPGEEELIQCMPRNPNPYLGFRGDPAGYSRLEDGTINWDNYGAYAPAVAAALNDCVLRPSGAAFEAHAEQGVSYEQVARSILDGFPVMVWVTKRGEPATASLDVDDTTVRLFYGEHVWVVVAYYEDGTFDIHDPYPQGNGSQTFHVGAFPNWDLFDRMAVFVRPAPSS